MNKKTASIVSLGLILGLSSQAFSKPNDQGHFGGHDRNNCMTRLELTDVQKKEMFALKLDMKNNDRNISDGHRAQVKELMNEPSFNEEKAKALVKLNTEKHESSMMAMLKKRYEMRQILTPEQRVSFDECQANNKNSDNHGQGKGSKQHNNRHN